MKRNVGRPREFDPTDFLNVAQALFWQNGYRATSIADLKEKSGLASASIYKLYPDKHAIFLAALRHYMDAGLARLTQRETELEPETALAQTLDFFAQLSAGPDGSRGCFSIAAASELLPSDEDVRDLIEYMFSGLISRLTRILRKGQRKGVFRDDYDADVMAESLFMMLEGMRLYGKVKPKIENLRRSNEFFINSVLVTPVRNDDFSGYNYADGRNDSKEKEKAQDPDGC